MTPRHPIVPSVTPEDLLELARAEGWAARDVVEAGHDAPFQIIWSVGSGTATYVEDSILDVRYVSIDPPSDVVEAALAARGMILSVADIAALAEAAETPQDVLAAMCYVGAVADDRVDARLAQALERGLGHTEPEVRRVAVLAAAYAAWPFLLPRLDQIAQLDPDPEAGALAGQVAAVLRTSNGQEAAS